MPGPSPTIINPAGNAAQQSQVHDRLSQTFNMNLDGVRPQGGGGAGGQGAQAFTGGNPLFFGPKGYDPGMTAEMRQLMAHELTHVTQQGPIK